MEVVTIYHWCYVGLVSDVIWLCGQLAELFLDCSIIGGHYLYSYIHTNDFSCNFLCSCCPGIVASDLRSCSPLQQSRKMLP